MTVSPIAIQKALGGLDYPADKDTVVKHAQKHGASDEVLDALKSLPEKTFDGPTGVSEALS